MWLLLLTVALAAPGAYDLPCVDNGHGCGARHRARLARIGAARLTQDATPLSGERGSAVDDPLQLLEVGERVQARWRSSELELLVWLDAEDLAPLTTYPGPVRSSPTAHPPGELEGMAHILRMATLELGEEHGDYVWVRGRSGWVDAWTLTGWIPSDAVARWIPHDARDGEPGTRLPQGFSGPGEWRWLAGSANILDRPRGTVVAQPAWGGKAVVVVGPPQNGYVPIRGTTSAVAGWVRKRDLAATRPLSSVSCVRSYDDPPADAANVARGTYLYDRPGGTRVGVTFAPLRAERPAPDDWGVLRHATPWGTAELAVPPDALGLRANWPPEPVPYAGEVDEFGLPLER